MCIDLTPKKFTDKRHKEPNSFIDTKHEKNTYVEQ